MSEFYRLEDVSFMISPFAFCDLDDNHQSADTCPRCPKCNRPIGRRHWLEPRKVVLSKPQYGDFVPGGEYLVSENFKSAYEQSDLKGIREFVPVEISKVRYMRKTSPQPPQYYVMNLKYSFAKIDLEKSFIKWGTPDPERMCSLCNPFGTVSTEIRGLHIDAKNWGGEDIFHLHEIGGVYASQKFIDFCTEKKFTNFKYVNTKDYIFPNYKFGD